MTMPGSPENNAPTSPVEVERPPAGEVQAYVKRLLFFMGLGVIAMVCTAVWAWNRYGGKFETSAPLPEGKPPISHVPQPLPAE
ncbi:MAG: hypothetical protein MK135_00550 [Polyangiaceae bacterium]|nr:hypothetical protein [Polyangiaceae bacterium]